MSPWSWCRTTGLTFVSSHRSIVSRRALSSSGGRGALRMAPSVVGGVIDAVAALRDKDGADEVAHGRAVLVPTDGLDRDDAVAGPAGGLTLFQNFGFGVERVAAEDRRGQPDFLPAE